MSTVAARSGSVIHDLGTYTEQELQLLAPGILDVLSDDVAREALDSLISETLLASLFARGALIVADPVLPEHDDSATGADDASGADMPPGTAASAYQQTAVVVTPREDLALILLHRTKPDRVILINRRRSVSDMAVAIYRVSHPWGDRTFLTELTATPFRRFRLGAVDATLDTLMGLLGLEAPTANDAAGETEADRSSTMTIDDLECFQGDLAEIVEMLSATFADPLTRHDRTVNIAHTLSGRSWYFEEGQELLPALLHTVDVRSLFTGLLDGDLGERAPDEVPDEMT